MAGTSFSESLGILATPKSINTAWQFFLSLEGFFVFFLPVLLQQPFRQAVPKNSNYELLLKICHFGAPMLSALVDVFFARAFAVCLSEITDIQADRLMMMMQLCSSWLMPMCATLLLHENCAGGWKQLWSSCNSSGAGSGVFDWSIFEEKILTTTEVCAWSPELLLEERCSRSVVADLSQFVLRKNLTRLGLHCWKVLLFFSFAFFGRLFHPMALWTTAVKESLPSYVIRSSLETPGMGWCVGEWSKVLQVPENESHKLHEFHAATCANDDLVGICRCLGALCSFGGCFHYSCRGDKLLAIRLRSGHACSAANRQEQLGSFPVSSLFSRSLHFQLGLPSLACFLLQHARTIHASSHGNRGFITERHMVWCSQNRSSLGSHTA